MRSSILLPIALATFSLNGAVCVPIATAQDAPRTATWSQTDAVRIMNDVQKKLGGLTTYGVFDWITFETQGKSVVLKGYASRPVLKSDVGAAVKSIAGIESVDNRIEVLPNLPNDDRIRASVYNGIFTNAAMRKYSANAG